MMLDLHIALVFYSFGVIFFADKEAFAWMRGLKQTLDARHLTLLHALMWLGLAGLIASGLSLFLPMANYLLHEPLFIMKLLLVAILIVNALLIGRLLHIATTRPFASLTGDEKLALFASGATSVVGWVGSVVIALALFY